MIPSFGDATAAARRIRDEDYSLETWARDAEADAHLLAAFVLAGQDTERPEDDEALVERVARALYDSAMQERQTFSREPHKFSTRWDDNPDKGELWRRGWREEARAIIAGKGGV